MTVVSIAAAQDSGRKLTLSRGASRHSKRAKQDRMTWPMFVDKVRTPTRTNETYAEYLKLPKTEQDAIKDVGWFVGGRLEGGIRKKDKLKSRDFLTLDIDFADKDFDFDLDMTYSDYAFVVYSTHKHCAESPRLRLVFPLLRSVTPDEYPAVARMVASWWGMDIFDDTTFQASRVMYWPSCSKDAEFVLIESESDRYIDPDQVLAQYDDWSDIASWPVSSRQEAAIETRVAKAADPLEKRGVIGDFCRAYSIRDAIAEFLPEVYTPGANEDRFSFSGGSTSNGAIVYNDDRFLYSNHGTDPCGGHSVNAFDLVRIHKFGELDEKIAEDTGPTKRPSFKAMSELVNKDERVADRRIDAMADDWDDEIAQDADEAPEKLAEDNGVPLLDTAGTTYSDDDREALRALDYNEDGTLKNHITNAILLLQHTKALKGCVALNEFTQDIMQVRDLPGMPVRNKVNGDLWEDKHDSWAVAYIHRKHGIELPGARMAHAINNVAGSNRFHPVRDYLSSLEWDGKKRLDSLLIKHFKADSTDYVRAVTRKTLCAAVARIFEPGTKFDEMLILEGLQGIGKSSFLAALACGWFTDNVGSFGKDSVENMKGKWIGEVGELTQFKKAEVEHIKAFLSRSSDRIREAYAKRSKDYPRQWIVLGSTNDDDYLKDTENRRMWPVRCHAKSFVKPLPPAEIGQIWAEALALWRGGESLALEDPNVQAAAKAEQLDRQSDRDTVDELFLWLEQSPDDGFDSDDEEPGRRETVSVSEIWEGFYSGRGKPDAAQKAQVRKLMRMVSGWSDRPEPRKVNGRSVRVFIRT